MKAQYKNRPKNKEEAIQRGKQLIAWLKKETGVAWKLQTYENLGWFYNASFGSLSLSQYSRDYGGGGFLLMNGFRHGSVGGHMSATAFHPKTLKHLIKNINSSLEEFKNYTQYCIEMYNKHSKMKQFKKLES